MISILISLAICYAVALAGYRVFLHPLRQFPGPTLAAVTQWYEIYYNLLHNGGGGFVSQTERLHKRYGAVVRTSPNTLHFSDKQAYHAIYTQGLAFRKDEEFYQSIFGHAHNSVIALSDLQEVKARRSALNPLFSRRAILALEDVIQENIDKLVALLQTQRSSVALPRGYRSLAMDIITSYCFAKPAHTLDAQRFDHPLIASTHAIFRIHWVQRYFPVFTTLTRVLPGLLIWVVPQYGGLLGMKKTLETQIDEYLREESSLYDVEHETIYHHLLTLKDESKRLSRTSLVQEAVTLLVAGSDTVSNTCTLGTYYAMKHSSIRRKLVEELRRAWPDKDVRMKYTSLEDLPYLTAFIKESLRMAQGVIIPLPRVSQHDTSIAGFKVPAGTVVGMSHIHLHNNPDVFPNPNVFDPERWLVEDTSEMMHDLSPFSKGPRICLGMNLAWCELYLILANVFRRLDLTLHVTDDMIDDYSHGYKDFFEVAWDKTYRVFVSPACE